MELIGALRIRFFKQQNAYNKFKNYKNLFFDQIN